MKRKFETIRQVFAGAVEKSIPEAGQSKRYLMYLLATCRCIYTYIYIHHYMTIYISYIYVTYIYHYLRAYINIYLLAYTNKKKGSKIAKFVKQKF